MADLSKSNYDQDGINSMHNAKPVTSVNAPVTLRCSSCSFTCQWNSELALHRRLNHRIIKRKCRYCMFRASSLTILKRHIMQNHGNGTASGSGENPVHFAENYDLFNVFNVQKKEPQVNSVPPVKQRSRKNLHTCPLCNYRTFSRYLFAQHKVSHSSKKVYRCSECDYFGNDSSAYKKHMSAHGHLKGAFKCSLCSFTSDFPRAIRSHETLYHDRNRSLDERKHDLAGSDSQNNTESSKKRVLDKTDGEDGLEKKRKLQSKDHDSVTIESDNTQDYFDKEQLKRFDGKQDKADKIKPTSSARNTQYPCAECSHISQSKMEQCMHVATHSNQPLFRCAQCEYFTPHPYAYQVHLKNHQARCAFKCDLCSYSSNKDHVIRAHRNSCHPKSTEPETGLASVENKLMLVPKKVPTAVTSVAQIAASRLKKKAQSRRFGRKVLPKRSAATSVDEKKSTLESIALGLLRKASNVENGGHSHEHTSHPVNDSMGSGLPANNVTSSSATAANGFIASKFVRSGQVIKPGRKVYACNECTFRSRCNINFKRHRLCHTEPARYRCGVCTYSSNMASKISDHQRFHPNAVHQPMSDAGLIKGQTSTPIDAAGRMRKVSLTKDGSDDVYHDNSMDAGGNTDQFSPGTGLVLTYKCPFCPHKTPKRGNMKIHIRRRHYRNALAQGGLDACFNRLHRSLGNDSAQRSMNHTVTENGASELAEMAEFAPDIDGEAGDFDNNLSERASTSSTRDQRCEHCNFATTTPYKLRLHINSTHLQLRLHQCPACDFRSNWSSNVVKHIHRIHPGEARKVVTLSHAAAAASNVSATRTPVKMEAADKEFSGSFNHQMPAPRSTPSKPDSRYSADRAFMCSNCKFRSAWRHSVQQHIRYSAQCQGAQLVLHPSATAAGGDRDAHSAPVIGAKVGVGGRSLWKPSFKHRHAGSSSLGSRRPVPVPIAPHPSSYATDEPNDDVSSTASSSAAFNATATTSISPLYGGRKQVKIFKCTHCAYTSHMAHRMKKHTKLHSYQGLHRCPFCTFSSDVSKTVTFHLRNWHTAAEKAAYGLTDDSAHSRPARPASAGSVDNFADGDKSMDDEEAMEAYSLLQNDSRMNDNSSQFNVTAGDTGGAEYLGGPAPQFTFKCPFCSFGAFKASSLKGHVLRVHRCKVSETECGDPEFLKTLELPPEVNKSLHGSRMEGGDLIFGGDNVSFGSKLHKCPYCSYQIDSRGKMLTHIEAHGNKRRYMCGYCGQRANWRVVIRGHIRLNHPNQTVDIIVLTDKQLRAESGGQGDLSQVVNGTNSLTVQGHAEGHRISTMEHEQEGGSVGRGMVPLYKCSVCGFMSRSRPYMRKHMRRQHRSVQCHLMTVWLNAAQPEAGPEGSSSGASSSPSANIAHSDERDAGHGGETRMIPRAYSWRCSACNWTSKWPNSVYSHIVFKHSNNPEAKAIKVLSDNKAAPWHRVAVPAAGSSRNPQVRVDRRQNEVLNTRGRHFYNGMDRYWCRQCKYHSPYSHHVRRHIVRKHAFSIQPVVDLTTDKQFAASLRGGHGAHASVSDGGDGRNGGSHTSLGSIVVRNVFNLFDDPASVSQPIIKQEMIDDDEENVDSFQPSRSSRNNVDENNSPPTSSEQGIDDEGSVAEMAKKHAHGRVFSCRFCPFKTYQTVERLLLHESLHGSGQRYQCKFCSYAASQPCNISKHLRLVHKMDFISSGYVDREQRDGSDGASFRTSNGLGSSNNRHGDIVENGSRASSLMDAARASDEDSIGNDEETGSDADGHGNLNDASATTVHGRINETASNTDSPKVYRCRYCPFNTATSNGLHEHSQGHQISARLRCPFCTYSASVGIDLQMHIGLHFMGAVEKAADEETASQANDAPNDAAPTSTADGDDENGMVIDDALDVVPTLVNGFV